jgi:PAS domain S-box-containing protein
VNAPSLQFPARYSLSLAPDLSESARMRVFLDPIAEGIGFASDRRFDILVAVSEAVANAIEHAHGEGQVRVEARVLPDGLEVTVQGSGEFHLPAKETGREHRGLGLPLMAKFADHLALFSAADGGTLVTLTFHISPAARPTTVLAPSMVEALNHNAFLEKVLNILPDAFYILDHDWRFAWVNDRVVEQAQMTREQMLGRVIWDLFPEHDREARRLIEKAKKEAGAVTASHPGPGPGSWREWSAFPVAEGMAVLSRDISERERAEWERDELVERLRTERGQLQAILASMEEAVGIWSPAGELLDVNEATVRMHGFSNKEEMRRSLSDFAEVELRTLDGRLLPMDEWPAAKVIRGESFASWEVEVRLPAKGVRFIGSYSGAVVRDAAGDMVLGVTTIHDVTDLHEAQELAERELETSRLLLRAAAALNTWTDLPVLLKGLAHMVLEATGHSRVTIVTCDQELWEWHVAASVGRAPGPARVVPYEALSAGFRQVVTTRRTVINDYDAAPEADRGPGRSHDAHLALQVPMSYRGRLLGVIGIDDPGERREFRDREIAIVEAIAAQAAVAIENARLYQEQKTIADTLQQALLRPPESVPGVRVGYLYRSATEAAFVGGDFFDVYPLHEDCIGIAIGDVSGHGVNAATLGSLVRDTLRAYALQELPIEQVMALTNQAICRQTELSGFTTLFFGLLHPHTGRLEYSGAGHPPALLRRGSGDVQPIGWPCGPPLGVFAGERYLAGETSLESGDLLLLYTDGLIEVRKNGELFGEERLRGLLEGHEGSVEQLPDSLLAAVIEFGSGSLGDDLAVLALTLAVQGER